MSIGGMGVCLQQGLPRGVLHRKGFASGRGLHTGGFTSRGLPTAGLA